MGGREVARVWGQEVAGECRVGGGPWWGVRMGPESEHSAWPTL